MNQKGLSQILVILLVVIAMGGAYYLGTQKITNINISSPTKIPGSQETPDPTVLPTSPNPTQNPAPTTTPNPTFSNSSNPNAPTSIKIAYPNGGESFKVGDNVHITWSSNNLSKNGSCIVSLFYENESKSTAWIPVNTPNGFYDWKFTSDSAGSKAKIDMDCYDSNQNNVHDQSDNFFSITN